MGLGTSCHQPSWSKFNLEVTTVQGADVTFRGDIGMQMGGRVLQDLWQRRTTSCSGNRPTWVRVLSRRGQGEGDAYSMPSFWILVPMELGCKMLADLASGETEEGRDHRFQHLASVCMKGFTKFTAFS